MLLASCLKTCEMLRNLVSPNPADRGEMSDVTSFLRDLAAKITARVENMVAEVLASRAALASQIERPPAVEAPAIAPASGLPAAGPVRVGGDRSGGAPAGVPSAERVHLAPPPVAAPHAEGEARSGSGPPAAGPSAAVEAAEVANAASVSSMERVRLTPPPVAAPVAEREAGTGSGPPSTAPPVAAEPAEPANVVMPSLEENAGGGSSVERVYFAPPSVAAPIAEGGARNGSRPAPADPPVAVELAEPANVVMPSLEENAAGGSSVERVHFAPPSIAAPIAADDNNGASAAVRGSAPRGLGPRGSAPLAAAVGPMAIAAPPSVAAPHAEEGGSGTGATAPPVEAVEAPRGSLPLVDDSLAGAGAAEAANLVMPYLQELAAGVPSVKRVHFAPPPIVVPVEEGGGDDTRAGLSKVDAVEALPSSAPPAMNPRAEVEATDADDGLDSLEMIDECMNCLFRPIPRSPAEVFENHMAGILRTLRCPPPRALNPPAGQAYSSGNGGSSGDSSGNGVGGVGGRGGSGVGTGRATVGEASHGVIPGLTEVKGRRPLVAACRPFWTPECLFLKRFW